MEKKEKQFVLVHGACHGAWCQYKVVTLLKSTGHRVTALDMAATGIHPKQLHEIRSISDYYEPLMEIMASLPPQEKVILVDKQREIEEMVKAKNEIEQEKFIQETEIAKLHKELDHLRSFFDVIKNVCVYLWWGVRKLLQTNGKELQMMARSSKGREWLKKRQEEEEKWVEHLYY